MMSIRKKAIHRIIQRDSKGIILQLLHRDNEQSEDVEGLE